MLEFLSELNIGSLYIYTKRIFNMRMLVLRGFDNWPGDVLMPTAAAA
jgi:hypothetical protein